MTPHIVSFGVIGIVWDKSARAGGRHWGAAGNRPSCNINGGHYEATVGAGTDAHKSLVAVGGNRHHTMTKASHGEKQT